MITFSNPRLSATFNDWPSGSKRVTCVFNIEHHPKRGYRVTRTTTGKPKTNTYGGRAAIVDGSDGRTYILQCAGMYDFIMVSASDFKNARKDVLGFEAPVWPRNEVFATLETLIDIANAR